MMQTVPTWKTAFYFFYDTRSISPSMAIILTESTRNQCKREKKRIIKIKNNDKIKFKNIYIYMKIRSDEIKREQAKQELHGPMKNVSTIESNTRQCTQ